MKAVSVNVFAHGRGRVFLNRFYVGEGDPIGLPFFIKDVDEQGDLKPQPMDFSTHAVAVHFDPTKTVKKGNMNRSTVEIVYLDAKGQLRTRVGAIDMDSEHHKDLKKDAALVKAAIEASANTGR